MGALEVENLWSHINMDEEKDSEEYFEHFHVSADKGQSLLRIDKFLSDRLPNFSRNRIQQAAKSGNIKVNGDTIKSNYKVRPYDEISFVMPYPPRDKEVKGEDIQLDIVYEDEELLVLNKPANMVVHPGYGNFSGTLVNALVYHFDQLPELKGNEGRPGLVHRLDKNTTGLMVIAKTEFALSHLAKQFFDRTTDRRYQALVWGNLEEDEGRIEGNIWRSHNNRKIMDVFPEREIGKAAITNFKVLRRYGYVSLVEYKLETGRTHQIRVHSKWIGHPLFNDAEYGGNRILKGTTFTKYKQFVLNCFKICQRQALHAKSLGFAHPTTKKEVNFASELAEDMQQLIEKWRKYAIHQLL